MEMTKPNTQRGSSFSLPGQVVAVGAGAAVAVVGGFVGVMGALSCIAGCEGVTPGIVVAYVGLAIMAASPFVIARVSKRDRWLVWGALGLATGASAFFLGRAVVGRGDHPWAVIIPSFGLAAVLALPARNRWLVMARAVGVLAFSMVPALMHDSGMLVQWVVREVPGGRTEGWEDHGEFLTRLALLGLPVGLFLPDLIRRRSKREA